jgi:hypothetical protein
MIPLSRSGDGGNYDLMMAEIIRMLGTKFALLNFVVITGSFCNFWKCKSPISPKGMVVA